MAVLLGALLSAGQSASAAGEVTLRDGRWTAIIAPATLRVELRRGNVALPVSAGQASLGPVARLEPSERRLDWDLPEQRLAVSMRLQDEVLSVHLLAHR